MVIFIYERRCKDGISIPGQLQNASGNLPGRHIIGRPNQRRRPAEEAHREPEVEGCDDPRGHGLSARVLHAQQVGWSPHSEDTFSGGVHRSRPQGVYIRSGSAEDVSDDDVQRPATDGPVGSSVQGPARRHDAGCLSVGRQSWLRRTVGRQQYAPDNRPHEVSRACYFLEDKR